MPKRNLAWIVIVAMIAFLMWQLPQTIAGRDSVLRAFGPLVDARAQIRKRFVDKVDDDELVDAAVDQGIRAMVHQLQDPHAMYLNSAQYKRFQARTDGLYGGIGVEVWTTRDGLEVLSREPHSPAVEAGILPGDIITQIDGAPTPGMSLVEAVNNRLNGPRGTEVRLLVVTPDAPPETGVRELVLYRTVIRLDPVRGWSRDSSGGWRFMLDPELGIGYVRLTKFTSDVDERLDEEMGLLQRQGLHALILDLRGNTGGLLDSAREVADRFLESGLIVRTKGRTTDEKQWFAMREGTYPNFPMAILVNGWTASAAEIVAGALRDHRRAVVVGERTYGKGSVQEVVELSRGEGAIKLTTAYYYLPSGQCIQRTARANRAGTWGVAPNLPVHLTEGQRARWLAAWRQIGREVSPRSSEPDVASRPAVSEARLHQDAAEKLMDADLQLLKACEHLKQQLTPVEDADLLAGDQLGARRAHRPAWPPA